MPTVTLPTISLDEGQSQEFFVASWAISSNDPEHPIEPIQFLFSYQPTGTAGPEDYTITQRYDYYTDGDINYESLYFSVTALKDNILESDEELDITIDGEFLGIADSAGTLIQPIKIIDVPPPAPALPQATTDALAQLGTINTALKNFTKLTPIIFGESDPQIVADSAKFAKALGPVGDVLKVTALEAQAKIQLDQDLANAQTPEDRYNAQLKYEVTIVDGLDKILFTAALTAVITNSVYFPLAEVVVGAALSTIVGTAVSPLIVSAVIAGAIAVGVGAAYDQFVHPIVVESVKIDNRPQVVIHGYLSDATVFVDLNFNGQLDADEPSTTTDTQGRFVLPNETGPEVAFGGTDTSTDLPFKGQLSAPAGFAVITPLTTLLSHLQSDPAAQAKVLAGLGLSQSLDLTTLDPIAAGMAGDMAGGAAEVAAAKVYDTVSLVASALAATGGSFGAGLDDAFSALASALDGPGINLTDRAAVVALISDVAQLEGTTFPAGISDAVASIIVASNAALDRALQSDQTGDQLLADSAAIELIIQGAASSTISRASAHPDQLPQVVDLFTGDNLASLIERAKSQVQDLGHDLGPIALDGSNTTDQNTILSGSVSAVALNGGAVTYALNGPAPAGLTFNPDGTFSFDPRGTFDYLSVGEHAATSFQYTATDGVAPSNIATETITIEGLNDNPSAIPDSNGVAKGSSLSVSAANGVLANDSDPDIHDHLFVSSVNGLASNVGQSVNGAYGSLSLNADGSYGYTATKGNLLSQLVAQDTFSYSVADGHGGTATTTLNVVVFNPGASYQAGINTVLSGGNGSNILDGSAGHDTLVGGNGADVLIGGDGDTLYGGNGPDTFLFRPGSGASTIKDFDVHSDMIQFDKSMFQLVNAIVSHITDGPAGAVIADAQGDAVTVAGVSASQLAGHPNVFHLP